MTHPLYAVAGATGQQGGSVARALLANPDRYRMRALTRDPSKPSAQKLAEFSAEVVRCDIKNREGLLAAFEGVHGVFVSSTIE
jgi:uncharacterized protein YbjT (DUF2867 family)